MSMSPQFRVCLFDLIYTIIHTDSVQTGLDYCMWRLLSRTKYHCCSSLSSTRILHPKQHVEHRNIAWLELLYLLSHTSSEVWVHSLSYSELSSQIGHLTYDFRMD